MRRPRVKISNMSNKITPLYKSDMTRRNFNNYQGSYAALVIEHGNQGVLPVDNWSVPLAFFPVSV